MVCTKHVLYKVRFVQGMACARHGLHKASLVQGIVSTLYKTWFACLHVLQCMSVCMHVVMCMLACLCAVVLFVCRPVMLLWVRCVCEAMVTPGSREPGVKFTLFHH